MFVDQVRAALYASKVVAYAQGFDQIAAGAEAHGWDIDLGEVATIWRGGCIIRAQFLDRIKEAYADEPDLTTLLTTAYFADAVKDGVDAWREVVATAARGGVPTPAFSSSLAYFDGLRRDRLPAALIQALRDNFGAHTYERVDREGTFHTRWAERRACRGVRPADRPPTGQPKVMTWRIARPSASSSMPSLMSSRAMWDDTRCSTGSRPARHRSAKTGMSRLGTAEPR